MDSASGSSEMMAERMRAVHEGAKSFLRPEGRVSRARAGLLFIESYRELPLLTWPRKLIDAIVELEESMVKWRHSHARMVERIMWKEDRYRWNEWGGLSGCNIKISSFQGPMVCQNHTGEASISAGVEGIRILWI